MLENTPSLQSNLDTVISNSFGEHYLFAVNHNAFQHNDASTVFRTHYGQALFLENTFYIIVGTDSGLLYQYIKDQVPKGSRYLFIEPAEILERLIELNHPDGLLVATTPDKWMAVGANEMAMNDFLIQERVILVSSLAAVHGHYKPYLSLLRKVRENINYMRGEYRCGIDTRPFILCQLQNLTENQVPAISLQNRFPGKTAVVLAGGPSLDEVLPWVKQHRKNLLVIAVSRVSYALVNAGIEPDICVSVDPYPFNFYVCKEIMAFQETTLLVNEYHLCSNLLSSWGGLKAFTGTLYPWTTPLQPDNLKSEGGTVTNTALSIAIETGVSQIVLGGADFCFHESGRTHAAGSAEYELGSQPMYGDRRVETNGGVLADTDRTFDMSALRIDQQAKIAFANGCRVINPAAGARRLANVEHVLLDALEVPAMEMPAGEIIAACVPAGNTDTRRHYYKDILKEVTRIQNALRTVRTLALQALNYNDKLFSTNDGKRRFHLNSKLDGIERKLKDKFSDATRFIQMFGLRAFAPILRKTDHEAEDLRKDNELYFRTLAEIAKELYDILHSTRNRILSRIEEEQPLPELELLIDQWRKDKTPGRAIHWEKQHPDSVVQLSEEQRQKLREFQSSFDQSIEDLQQDYFDDIARGLRIDGLDARALEYFKCQDSVGLQSLLTGLHGYQNKELAAPFIPLINGYLAELRNDTDSAVKHYQSITDGPSRINALMRLFAIQSSQNDNDAACDTLKTLSAISPIFTPMYADMLIATGNVETAVEIYTDYLLANPNDLNSVMKLGKIYYKYGSREGVDWAMNYILSKDPTNLAAKKMLNSLDQQNTTDI